MHQTRSTRLECWNIFHLLIESILLENAQLEKNVTWTDRSLFINDVSRVNVEKCWRGFSFSSGRSRIKCNEIVSYANG